MQPSKENFWLNRLCAVFGNSQAQRCVGKWYEKEGIPQSMHSAFTAYFIAAEQGNAKAQFKVAQCLVHGWGVAQDIASGFNYYTRAADSGDLKAQMELAQCYRQGIHVPKNEVKAVHYYTLAAQKVQNMDVHYQLGCLYKSGWKDTRPDLTRAAASFHIAADLGCKYAQFEYAFQCLEGIGVAQNAEEALKYFHLAAAQDHGEACCLLGDMYKDGLGVPPNLDEALRHYRKGSDLEWAEADYRLAGFYTDQKEKDLAVTHYHKAAKKGHKEAQYDLGFIYEEVLSNPKKALKYYTLAAAQGHEDAVLKLTELGKRP